MRLHNPPQVVILPVGGPASNPPYLAQGSPKFHFRPVSERGGMQTKRRRASKVEVTFEKVRPGFRIRRALKKLAPESDAFRASTAKSARTAVSELDAIATGAERALSILDKIEPKTPKAEILRRVTQARGALRRPLADGNFIDG